MAVFSVVVTQEQVQLEIAVYSQQSCQALEMEITPH